MRKYYFFLKSNLAASLEYRGNLLIWLLIEFITLTSVVFLWQAAFRTNQLVGTYDLQKMLSYYLLVPFVGAFTSIYISDHLPRRIKDGEISKDLMQPYSLAFVSLINQFSIKITHLSIKLPIYAVVAAVFYHVFSVKFNVYFILLALLTCVFSYILHFSIDYALCLLAFWFDDAWSLSHLKMLTLLILGGVSFPLDLVPKAMQAVFIYSPFRFIYYFPIKVAQGAISFELYFSELLALLAWTVGFLLLGRILWRFGVRKYAAYGN